MELRQRSVGAMLGAALRACVAARSVCLAIVLICAACEIGARRYSTVSMSFENDTLELSFGAESEDHQLVFHQRSKTEDQGSVLSKVFPFSISLVRVKRGIDNATAENGKEEEDDRDALNPVASDTGHNSTRFDLEDGETKLQSLKIIYVANNASKGADATGLNAPFPGYYHPRDPPDTAVAAIKFLIAASFFLFFVFVFALVIVTFHQGATIGLIAYSVSCVYLRKRVKLGRAVASVAKFDLLLRLMLLALAQGVFSGIQCLFFSRVFIRSVKDVEALVKRLEQMPFAILAPVIDEEIVRDGLSRQVAAFLAADYAMDGLATALYILACWGAVLDRGHTLATILRKSWKLLTAFPWTALLIKVGGSAICGRSSRWLLERIMGPYAAVTVIVAADVYVTVLWLIFYVDARCRLEQRFDRRLLKAITR